MMVGMKIEIEMSDEVVDEIICRELKWARDYAKTEPLDHPDDIEQMEKLLPALELVCKYFGVDDD